jgi:hypothetical protein
MIISRTLRLALLGAVLTAGPWVEGLLAAEPAREDVVVLIDAATHTALEGKLARYCELVEAVRPVKFEIWAEPWHEHDPDEVRARLASAWARDGRTLAGAIFVGQVPTPLRDYAPDLILPAPLYYEDFDAVWQDADEDGDYETFISDRASNATEIWTAWWTPPANDAGAQVRLLDRFLTKLIRQYESPPPAANAILFGAGKVNSLRIGQSWAALFEAHLDSTDQRLRTYMQALPGCMSVHCRDGVEFTTAELLHALRGRRWQHLHLVTYGTPQRLFWNAGELRADSLDLADFNHAGPVLITCSASAGANFFGSADGTPKCDESIANQLLFAPQALTTAFFGSVKPGAAGAFAQYHSELFAALDPANQSYLAKGYQQMRNSDHTWGKEHYLFRGADEIALLGDPFFRYYPPRR